MPARENRWRLMKFVNRGGIGFMFVVALMFAIHEQFAIPVPLVKDVSAYVHKVKQRAKNLQEEWWDPTKSSLSDSKTPSE